MGNVTRASKSNSPLLHPRIGISLGRNAEMNEYVMRTDRICVPYRGSMATEDSDKRGK